MTTSTDKAILNLAKHLEEFRGVETTPERHIFLLWLITRGMTLLGAERPILVGGGAVEFYTGVRFATGDLDLVVLHADCCIEVLETLGFEKAGESNHWVNRNVAALVEIHRGHLAGKEEPIEVVYRKVPLLVVSPEDCIAERLASFRRHGSSLDLLSAFLVAYHHHSRLDQHRLQERIGAMDLWEDYSIIQDISRKLICDHGGVDEAAGDLIHFMKEGPRSCAF
jgi:hypothetical protein